jgi:hypothetical protein
MIPNDMEAHAEALRLWREGEDNLKVRAGLRVARMQTFYGDGTIEKVANDAGYSPKTLYTRRDVSRFMLQWMSATKDCNIFSVRRISERFPEITYTHIRMATPSERRKWDFEDACDALQAIAMGDSEWDEYEEKHGRAVVLPMTTDAFGRYLTWKRGGKPHDPIFRGRGKPLWITGQAWNHMWDWAMHNGGKEVEIIIREAR